MTARKTQMSEYQSLAAPRKKSEPSDGGLATLKPLAPATQSAEIEAQTEIKNFHREKTNISDVAETRLNADLQTKKPEKNTEIPLPQSPKLRKKEKIAKKDFQMIASDRWIARNGHNLTYIGLYLFSILVLFRPYELVPGLGFLSATAFYFAFATLLIYVPTQLSVEGSLTMLSTEVKCVLALVVMALVTLPIGKDPKHSWEVFNDTFIKAALMFIVMVNVLRSRKRMMGLLHLSLAVAAILSYLALGMFMRGELKAEGYRVAVNVGGMFGNPNDMAMHLVTMIPLAVCLGFASKKIASRLTYFGLAILFLAANFVTYSRGGFLGFIVSSLILVWKLGRGNRLKAMLLTSFVGLIVILLAPGNYGLRILSIFIPGLDEVGSGDQRKELLFRSLFVTARNPWGVGMGNFRIMNDYGLESHNAYTQVSSELGLIGLGFYLTFIVSPLRKLMAIERTLAEKNSFDWYYYLSVGLQASIAAYMVSSFFGSVAYNWFAYYLIAYAVAFRRIYSLEREEAVSTVPR